jgi:hypothetical protein
MPTSKRIPLGAPLNLSDETLEALTTAEAIAPDEIKLQELRAKWQRLVPAFLVNLLDAEMVEDAE